MKTITTALACFCIVLWLNVSSAGSENLDPYNFAAAQQELNKISQMDLQTTSLAYTEILLQQVRAYVDQGKQCASVTQQELEQIEKGLVALGEKVTGESKDIGNERSELLTLKNQNEVRGAQCRLLTLKASDIEEKLQKNKKQIFTRDLLARDPGFFEIVSRPEMQSLSWLKPLSMFFVSGSGLSSLSLWHFFSIFILVGLGGFLGKRLGSLFSRYAAKIEQEGLFFYFLQTIGQRKRTFQLFGAMGVLSFSASFFMSGLQPSPYLPYAINSIFLALILSTIGKIYGLVIVRPIMTDAVKVKFPRFGLLCLYVFSLLSGLLFFVFSSPLKHALPEAAFYLIRALTITLWYGVLVWSFWLACNFSQRQSWRRVIRLILFLMFGGVMLAELSGYRTLAAHILTGTSGTLFLALLFGLAHYLANEVIGGLGRGKYTWQKNLRQKVGIKHAQVFKGIIWTNSLVKLLLIIGFIHEILKLWGISRLYASAFYDWLVEGFSLGTITIVPSRIGVGFLIFTLGSTVVSLVKDKIIRKWLAESEVAPSVQDAFSTVLGYVGYSIVIIIGLSTAGINFTGLAVVAGALSVGIGFGLQNIVNNLVSGLILLFERPIKRGDWIAVGATEGHVKKISVRSTIVQTFDRSDVIVPNSELISNQVTNMMLEDTRGRVRVAVGVAYGSNTELVKELLLDVARSHPDVINSGAAPYPVVRFQAFGESSLDFELVAHLRDVDKRIDVRSDMHFAIDKAFRKHDIQIPFPQRDVHIKGNSQEVKES